MVAWLLPSNRARFGAAHAARSLAWAAIDLLLAWHLHVRVGLTGVQTGWLLCLFLLVGAVATALAGRALDRGRATGARAVRVQLPATCITAMLLWAQFAVHGATAAIAVGLAFRLSYAVQDVAQNMLAALLPRDDADARGYARLRVMLSAGTRCLIVAGFALATARGMVALLAVVGALMVASAFGLRGATFAPHAPARPADRGARAIPAGLPALLLAWVMTATLLPTVTRLLIFAPPVAGAWSGGVALLGGYCLGTLIGPALRELLGRSVVLAIVVASGALLIVPLGIGPTARIAAAVLHGIGVSIINVHLWAATSQLAIDERRAGRNADGTIFGAVIMTLHLATALSMVILGPLIDQLGDGGHQAPAISLVLTAFGAIMIACAGHRPKRAASFGKPALEQLQRCEAPPREPMTVKTRS
jgi:Na+/melibiose symporter-like transporter